MKESHRLIIDDTMQLFHLRSYIDVPLMVQDKESIEY